MTMPSVTNATASSNSSPSQTSYDLTLTISSNSGRVLFCFPALYDTVDGAAVDSVTFDPGGGDEASFTHITGTDANNWGSLLKRSEAWYLILSDGVTNGSYSVRVSTADAPARIGGSACEVANADTTDPVGNVGTGTGSGTEASVSVTTGTANSLVLGGNTHRPNSTFTEGSGDTEHAEWAQNLNSIWLGSTPASSTGSYTVSCSDGSGEWAMSGVEVLEAATGDYTVSESDALTMGESLTAELTIGVSITPDNPAYQGTGVRIVDG